MSTILVVEDEVVVAKDIQRTLKALNYQVPSTAHTGADALRLVEENQPDLVLMDITLKGDLDGIVTASKIRARWDIPIIFLTAHSDDATLARAKETGPHGYVLKPWNERDLRTAIEVALRKHALEKVMSERERWFSTTLASIGDAIIATNPAGAITFMNPVAETLTGWKREDAVNKPVETVLRLVDEHGKPVDDPVKRAIRDRFCVKLPPNTQLLGAVGQNIDVDDSAAPILDERGSLLGGVVIFRDVTEHRRLQQRLLLSERLASIGTMAAGTAHEINNPLAAVLGNMTFAGEQLERIEAMLRALPGTSAVLAEVTALKEAVADAAGAAEHVRRIVEDIRKFARAGTADRRVLDLPEVLDSAIALTDSQVRQHARLSRQYRTTPLVAANEGQLVQVFTNLLMNAAQAIAADSSGSDRLIEISTRTDERGNAVVEVRDTGCGIGPDDLPRIFEPFFSTKGTHRGVGLGLSISHAIVASLGGELKAESHAGVGSTFRVTLPEAAATSRQPSAAKVETAPKRARVLVIDDDESVGRVVVRVLGQLHEVTAETEPQRALDRVRSGESFDVIFCDLMMPGLSGIDVHTAIQASHPEQAKRMVFLTGGSVTSRATQFLASVANPTVAKPFTVDGLRALVADYVA
jgi:PAS domain S-box-containing protein